MDFLARFSKLVNGMGQALIASWTKLIKSGDMKSAQDALQAIEAKVSLMLQLLIHEDDDISSNIIGFCYDYLHILKQVSMPDFSLTFFLYILFALILWEYMKLMLYVSCLAK